MERRNRRKWGRMEGEVEVEEEEVVVKWWRSRRLVCIPTDEFINKHVLMNDPIMSILLPTWTMTLMSYMSSSS